MQQPMNAAPEHPLPPITELAVGTMILVVTGGIYMAANIPGRVTLAPAVGLLIAAALLVIATLVALSRMREFAWRRFRVVFGWALIAYLVIAGMIELTFVLDSTPARPMLVLTAMLAIFAVDIPL